MDESSQSQSNHLNTTETVSSISNIPLDSNGNGNQQPSFHIPPSIASHPALANINWSALTDAQKRDVAYRLHEHTKFIKLQQAAANLKSFKPDQQAVIIRALQSQHQKMILLQQQQQQLQAKRSLSADEGDRVQKSSRSASMTDTTDRMERDARMSMTQPSSIPPPNHQRPPLFIRPQQPIPTLSITFGDLQRCLYAVPPFHPEMSEQDFLDSLSKFVGILKFTLSSLPLVRNRPIPIYKLFMMVYQVNGFESIEKSNRWQNIAASLGYPPEFEIARFLKTVYINVLLPYEQYFVQKRGIVEINCTTTISLFISLGPVAIKLSDVPREYQHRTVEVQSPPTETPRIAKIKTPKIKKTDVKPGFIQPQTIKLTQAPRKPASQWYVPTQVEDLGTVTYHNLLCELQCGKLDRQIHALNALQALAHHEKIPGNSRSFPQIIDEMVKLLLPYILPSKEGSKTYNELWRDYMMDIDLLEDKDTSIPDQVSNTIRAWSFKPDTMKVLASHSVFVNDVLLPTIINGSHLEVYNNCWIILDNMTPFLPTLNLGPIYEIVQRELEHITPPLISCIPKIFLCHSITGYDLSKRTLVNQLNRLNNLGRHIPPHLFMMLSTVCHAYRFQNQLGDKVSEPPISFIKALASFALPLFVPVMQLCKLFSELLICSITTPDKHITWLTRVIYNPNFCFRDSGYLEISLNLLCNVLSNSNSQFKKQFTEECDEFMDYLFALCTAMLNLWVHHTGTPIPSLAISRLFSSEVSDPENSSSFHLLHTSLRILSLLIDFHRCDMRVLEEWSELLFTSRVARVEPIVELIQNIWEKSFDSVCE